MVLEKFGKYQLVRRLAFGGMAEIFLARHTGAQGFSKRLVLKRILPQFGSDPDFVRMFVDEAVIAARLDHPNIVQVHDFGDVDGVYFISMEHVDGADLSQLLKKGRERNDLPLPAIVAAVGEEVCKGLSYAHNYADEITGPLNIVHRDISPHNIIVSRTGHAKVMDFGIAKAKQRVTKTSTGTIKGKVAYMAPEQLGGEGLDKRADQFAVGLVLRESITGQRFFRNTGQLELVREVMSYTERPLLADAPKAPEGLAAVIDRALRRDPGERFPDLADMAQALSAFRFSLGVAGAVDVGAWVDGLMPKQPTLENIRATHALPTPTVPLAVVSSPAEVSRSEVLAPESDSVLAAQASWTPQPDDVTGPTRVTPSGESSVRMPAPTSAHMQLEHDEGRLTTPIRLSHSTAPSSSRRKPVRWLAGGLLLSLAGVVGWFIGPVYPEDFQPKVGSAASVEVPVAARLTITSDPSVARIALSGRDTGLVTRGELPTVVGKAVRLTLSKSGYRTVVKVVDMVQEKQAVHIVLHALQLPAPGAEALVVALPSSPVRQGASSESVRRRPVETPPVRPRSKKGMLTLTSKAEWLKIYLGGKYLGETPVRGLRLPPGKHVLHLVNQGAGIDARLSVTIKANQVTKKAVLPKAL